MDYSDPEVINPSSKVLQQSEGMWQRYLALVLHKLAPEGVVITMDDIRAFTRDPRSTILTHGHTDSIEFKMVTNEEATLLAQGTTGGSVEDI